MSTRGSLPGLRAGAVSIGKGASAPAVLVLAAACVAAAIVAPRVFSVGGMFAISRSMVVVAIVGIAMMIVLGVGGMDLSVAGILEMSVASGLVALHTLGGGTLTQVAVTLAVATAAGVVNGLLIAYLGLSPLLATLATSFIYLAVALGITGGSPVGDVAPGVQWFGKNLDTVPVAVIVVVALAVVVALVRKYSPWYRQALLIGSNRQAATLDGTPVRRLELLAYTASGAICGLAGLVVTGQLSAFTAGQSGQLLLLALGVVIVGGTNLFGGRISTLGTLAGAALLSIITVVLALNYVAPAVQQVVQGAVLLVAVCIAAREPVRR